MSRHSVTLLLSATARAAALRAGLPAQGRQTWEVPPERKDLIAALLDSGLMPDRNGVVRFEPHARAIGGSRFVLADGTTSAELDSRPATIDEAVAAAVKLQKLSADLDAKVDAERAAWIAAHGSAHLKALFEEGLNYQGTYRGERIALERPGWVRGDKLCGKRQKFANPGMAEIEALRAERAKGVDDVRLVWLDCGPDGGCDAHLPSCPASKSVWKCVGVNRPVLACDLLGLELIRELTGV